MHSLLSATHGKVRGHGIPVDLTNSTRSALIAPCLLVGTITVLVVLAVIANAREQRVKRQHDRPRV